MTGRIALPISILMLAALLVFAVTLPPAAAQAVVADETHNAAGRALPIALSAAQKRAIYARISRERLRTSAADIPLTVGAAVPRSATLLTLPDEARGDDVSVQYLKYATVDGYVVLVDSISMRVIDIIRGDSR